MSTPISPNKAGLALGGTLASWHIVWAFLVATGMAQPFIDWVFKLHMIKPAYTITPFMLAQSVVLVIVTFVFGYLLGSAFASIWNKVRGK